MLIEPLESDRPTMNVAVTPDFCLIHLKGANRMYVLDQHLFHKGRVIIIHELFVAQIVDFGSLVLERDLDQTYLSGTLVRITSHHKCARCGWSGQTSTSLQTLFHGAPNDSQGFPVTTVMD